MKTFKRILSMSKTYKIIEKPYGVGLETYSNSNLVGIKWFDSVETATTEMEDCIKKDAKKAQESQQSDGH